MVALPLAIQFANVELARQRPPFFILVPPAAVGQQSFWSAATRRRFGIFGRLATFTLPASLRPKGCAQNGKAVTSHSTP